LRCWKRSSDLLADDPQRLHDAAERKALLMRDAMKETTPDLAAAVEAEPALSRIMSKDVATVRDSSAACSSGNLP
jgi:DNA polymerase I